MQVIVDYKEFQKLKEEKYNYFKAYFDLREAIVEVVPVDSRTNKFKDINKTEVEMKNYLVDAINKAQITAFGDHSYRYGRGK